MTARHPVMTHLLQTDPIISNPLNAQTYNPYSYVRNRPLVFTDPSGFTDEPIQIDPLTAFVMTLVCGLVCDLPPDGNSGNGAGNTYVGNDKCQNRPPRLPQPPLAPENT